MSHVFKKITYEQEGTWGSTEIRTLYCHQNNSCDIVSIYNDKGEHLFSYSDTEDRNLFNQLVLLVNSEIGENGVEHISSEERHLVNA